MSFNDRCYTLVHLAVKKRNNVQGKPFSSSLLLNIAKHRTFLWMEANKWLETSNKDV